MFSSLQPSDKQETAHRPWGGGSVPINLFFALLPTPETVAPIATLGETVCGAHGLRGRPIWPDRLHLTLLPVGSPKWDLAEIVRRARNAARRVRAAPFEIALDITESFYVRDRHPFVLGSGDGVQKLTALRKHLAFEMAREGFQDLSRSPFSAHMTLMWADHGVDEYPIAPIRWTVRDFVLVMSLVGRSRHEYLARWPLGAQGDF
ncbi:MAG: 2'-5' RNA ligase family protein [Rhizomicrobium sp.]